MRVFVLLLVFWLLQNAPAHSFSGTMPAGGGDLLGFPVPVESAKAVPNPYQITSSDSAWSWARNDSRSGYLAVDPAGSIIIGTSFSRITTLQDGRILHSTTSDRDDILLVKYSNSGRLLWAQHPACTGYDYATAVATDRDGNIFVAGIFSDTLDFGAGIRCVPVGIRNEYKILYDCFLAKYNAAGVVQWAVSVGGDSADYATGVAIDSSGAVFLTGTFEETAYFGNDTISTTGNDAFIAKFSGDGAVEWVRHSQRSRVCRASAIAVDKQGNSYTTGHYRDSVVFGSIRLTGKSTDEVFLVKYTSAGEVGWVKQITQASNFYFSPGYDGTAVGVDRSGNILLCGHFQTEADFGGGIILDAAGNKGRDAFLAKYAADGTTLWVRQITGTDHTEQCHSLAIDDRNTVYTAGIFYVPTDFGDSSPREGRGNADVFVASYDSSGAFRYVRTAGGSEYDGLSSIALRGDSTIIVSGAPGGATEFPGAGVLGKSQGFLAAINWVDESLLRMVYPNGGEVFQAGERVSVTWEGVLPQDTVTLSYSTDSGATWRTMTTQATGLQHTWSVPYEPSRRCLARVSAGVVVPAFTLAHEEPVYHCRWSPDGARIASTTGETVFVWDAATGNRIATCVGHTGYIYDFTWSPDGSRIASAGYDSTVRIWDAATGAELSMLHTGAKVYHAAWRPDGSKLAIAQESTTIPALLWEPATNKTFLLSGHTLRTTHIEWSSDGSSISTSSFDGTARIWNGDDGSIVRVLSGHTRTVYAARWSRDGTRIATVSQDSTARIWDAATGAVLLTIPNLPAIPIEAEWSPDDSKILIYSTETRTAGIWSTATGELLASLADIYLLYKVDLWSPDGTQIAGALSNGRAAVWDAATGAVLTVYDRHTGQVYEAGWNPDGRRVASVAADSTVRIWDSRVWAAGEDVSDSLWTIEDFGSMALEVGDAEAVPGEFVEIPVRLRNVQAALRLGVTSLRLTLAVDNSTILYPADERILLQIPVGDTLLIMLPALSLSEQNEELIRLRCRATLGNDTTSPVHVVGYEALGGVLHTDTVPGLFTLRGTCTEGGTVRLYKNAGRKAGVVVLPNPASDIAEVQFRLIEAGYTQLQLQDVLGNHIATIYAGEGMPGMLQAAVDLRKLPGGVYFVRLQTPTQIISVPVYVVR